MADDFELIEPSYRIGEDRVDAGEAASEDYREVAGKPGLLAPA